MYCLFFLGASWRSWRPWRGQSGAITTHDTAPRSVSFAMTCAECGYDLHGLPPDSRCPECGRSIPESVAAQPVIAWRPAFRRAVLFLGIGLLAWPPLESAIYRHVLSIREWSVNRDGLVYMVQALTLLPAAWWMTTPAPFLRPDPRRLRRVMVALTAGQVAGGIAAVILLNMISPACTVALLTIYALTPLAYVAEVWLLLVLLARPLPVMPDALPRWAVTVVRWAMVFSLLGPALVMAVVMVARMNYVDRPLPPPRQNYLPPPWDTLLNTFVAQPAYRARTAAWLASLLVIAHCLYRLRRGVGLPTKPAAS